MGKQQKELSYDQVLAGVQECISDVDYSIGSVESHIRLVEDLEFDSLDMVSMVLALEERFQITISDAEASHVDTVDGFVKLVMSHAG